MSYSMPIWVWHWPAGSEHLCCPLCICLWFFLSLLFITNTTIIFSSSSIIKLLTKKFHFSFSPQFSSPSQWGRVLLSKQLHGSQLPAGAKPQCFLYTNTTLSSKLSPSHAAYSHYAGRCSGSDKLVYTKEHWKAMAACSTLVFLSCAHCPRHPSRFNDNFLVMSVMKNNQIKFPML